MNVTLAHPSDERIWNSFVREHYPPIGAFMHTWEWGEFLKKWGKKADRYFVKDGEKIIAAFVLVEHELPLGFRYAYAPRGPLFARTLPTEEIAEIFRLLRAWVEKTFPQLIFVRFEPPLDIKITGLESPYFTFPAYYIQPRYNHAIDLGRSAEELLKAMHPSTRSNLNRALRRGVTVEIKEHDIDEEYERFVGIGVDTVTRNSGKNLYPARSYFTALFSTLPALHVKDAETHDPLKLRIATLYGYQNSELAAIHYVLFFGGTATYLYGASHTAHLSSKVTTYLHWAGMQLAKDHGMQYYDLGGVDPKHWPSLTDFKRQFRGTEFSYIGNIDVPLRPLLYTLYNLMRKYKLH